MAAKNKLPPYLEVLPSGRIRFRVVLRTPTGRRPLRSQAFYPSEKSPEELSALAVLAKREYERTGVWPGEGEGAEAFAAPAPVPPEPAAVPTFGELASEWLRTVVPVTLRHATQQDYAIILRRHVLPVFGPRAVDAITKRAVKEFLLAKLAQGYASSTVRHFINVLAGVFRLAEDGELIPANPAQRLGRLAPLAPTGRQVMPFTQGELEALLAVFRAHWPRHYPLVATLAHTGLRVGEALALRWRDVDFGHGRLQVGRTLSRGVVGPTKTAKVRLVELEPAAEMVLKETSTMAKRRALAMGRGGVEELVFPGIDLANWRARVWRPALAKARLEPRRIHDLRHTYATLRILAGVSMVYVSHQLGHSSLTLTLNTYTHWLPPEGVPHSVPSDGSAPAASVLGASNPLQ